IALVKTVNAISSYVVRHRIEYLHTKANRLTGFLLFVCVMTIGQPYFVPVAWGIACIALFAAIQEGHFIRSKQDIYTEWTDFNFYEYNNMKHEIIELHNVQMIGMAKKIAFNEAKEECPKFWGEYVEKIIKPVIFEKKEPNTFQKAAFDNGVGEFGLCTCDIPNHNCASCAEQNFGTCSKNTFTYVIGGVYKGGDVPEGMQLFPIHSGKWLKMHFEGGMKAFQEQYEKFHKEWLPAHPEYKWVLDSCCMEWYHGTDIQSPDYQCGVMMPLED
ncbi:MAG: GyrI-like domain-containing protein, partial [Prevotella sp.]|nr:GyrI-like domain-containing protein [Prevotella sp.]